MAISATEIESCLQAAFPEARYELVDLAGDNDHWQVTITSHAFAGKSRIQQHKMVFEAFKGKDIHALAVKTLIPET